jgi:hypothetical protein
MPSDEWPQAERPRPVNPPPPKNVLGDSLQSPPPLNRDALGRGRKGQAHGSIAYKTITQTRKSGKVKTYQQAWYQWQDPTGKHCRYLNKAQTAEVQRRLNEGAIVAAILAYLNQPKPQAVSKSSDQLSF